MISFSKTANNFPTLNIDSGQLEVVTNARILGLAVSDDLTCVRPVLEYSCQVFYFALPAYLSDAIAETAQREGLGGL